MTKAIIRIQKMKEHDVHKHSAHVMRTQETLNADKNRTNYNRILHGSDNPHVQVDKYINDKKMKKRNNETVVAVEILMSLSPEFFKTPGGVLKKQNTKDFASQALNFLKKKFGDKLVFAVLHLDESTPHIHATIIPDVDNKFNCKKMFDRVALQKLQTEYAECFDKSLNIERGARKSKAKHTPIKQYYGQVNSWANHVNKLKFEKPGFFERLGFGDYYDNMGKTFKVLQSNDYIARNQQKKAEEQLAKEKLYEEKILFEINELKKSIQNLKIEHTKEKTMSKLIKQERDYYLSLLKEIEKENPELINKVLQEKGAELANSAQEKIEESKNLTTEFLPDMSGFGL